MPNHDDDPRTITRLIHQWQAGDQDAAGLLFKTVYGHLRRLARAQMRNEYRERILQPTALVNEAYLKLCALDTSQQLCKNRSHFFHIASRAMREVLIDAYRSRAADRRGAGESAFSVDEIYVADPAAAGFEQLIILGLVLENFAKIAPQQADIFQCHVFGGMTQIEIARHMGIHQSKVDSELRTARAWLRRELTRTPHAE